jgi:hypothetical protein
VKIAMRWRWIMSLVVLLAGCASRTGDPAARPGAPTTSYLVKETTLVNGAVAVHLDIPLQRTGPKPAAIALLGDSHPIVAEGWVAVTYSVRWGLLRPPQPTPAPDQTVVGKWVLASPSADLIGQQYLRDIARPPTPPAGGDRLAGRPARSIRLAIRQLDQRFICAPPPSTAARRRRSMRPRRLRALPPNLERHRARRWRFRPRTPGCTARKCSAIPQSPRRY